MLESLVDSEIRVRVAREAELELPGEEKDAVARRLEAVVEERRSLCAEAGNCALSASCDVYHAVVEDGTSPYVVFGVDAPSEVGLRLCTSDNNPDCPTPDTYRGIIQHFE